MCTRRLMLILMQTYLVVVLTGVANKWSSPFSFLPSHLHPTSQFPTSATAFSTQSLAISWLLNLRRLFKNFILPFLSSLLRGVHLSPASHRFFLFAQDAPTFAEREQTWKQHR